MRKKEDYHIEVRIRDKNFCPVETFTKSGKDAILDTIYHLDTKYNPSAIDIIKKFW